MRRRLTALLSLVPLLLLASTATAQTGIITTYAGGGPNNMPATSASLDPLGVAVDASGNLYIAGGLRDNRVFRVDTAGQLTVFAGTGLSGFGGDGGPATEASLSTPVGVAFDASGNLYIADGANFRIRKVDSTGIINTVAGTGTQGFSGDGGPATSARLSFSRGVAVDGIGNLYIADAGNRRIRKVDSTGIITTVAGSGLQCVPSTDPCGDGGPATSARLSFSPGGVAIDGIGNLYIADNDNLRIRKVDTTGIITTVAGTGTQGFSGDGGPATSARLAFPRSVTMDGIGNLYIADAGNLRIRKVDTTGIITTVSGNGTFGFAGDGGPAINASLGSTDGVALDLSGNLYIVDRVNARIRKVDAAGTISTVAGGGGAGDGFPATSARLISPAGVALDTGGNLYVPDSANHCIRKVDTNGIITTVAGTRTAGFSSDGGPATSARLREPTGVALDAVGNLYIADTFNDRIRKVDTAGIITTVAGTVTQGFNGDGGPATSALLNRPVGVAVDGIGNLYIADTLNRRIRKVYSTGIITTVAGTGSFGFSGDGGPATSANLGNPEGVTLDTVGNLYIADTLHSRIRKVDATGIITTVAGSGVFCFPSSAPCGDGGPATSANLLRPTGVAFDAAGNFYIAEEGNNRIRKVDTNGIITTIVGTGVFGFGGNGGPATSARLAGPRGVALDGASNLYVADIFDRRIRRVVLNQPPVADAGDDRTLIVGESFQFDGNGSSDPDGTITTYTWDFGDGAQSSGAAAVHAYAASGTFTVTLSVEDDDGASASDTALVTVVTPAQAIQQLAGLVASYNLQQGIANSLDAKLQNARDALTAANAGQRQDAANKLMAFLNAVESQRGKELTSAQADELTALANRILAVL